MAHTNQNLALKLLATILLILSTTSVDASEWITIKIRGGVRNRTKVQLWLDAYENPASPQFNDLTEGICSWMHYAMKTEKAFQNAMGECKLTTFSKEPFSVIATVTFTATDTVKMIVMSATEQEIRNMFFQMVNQNRPPPSVPQQIYLSPAAVEDMTGNLIAPPKPPTPAVTKPPSLDVVVTEAPSPNIATIRARGTVRNRTKVQPWLDAYENSASPDYIDLTERVCSSLHSSMRTEKAFENAQIDCKLTTILKDPFSVTAVMNFTVTDSIRNFFGNATTEKIKEKISQMVNEYTPGPGIENPLYLNPALVEEITGNLKKPGDNGAGVIDSLPTRLLVLTILPSIIYFW